MSYKMSYKVRSLLFFFGFIIATLLYDGIDEDLLSRIDEPQKSAQELDNEELVKNQLETQGTIVNID